MTPSSAERQSLTLPDAQVDVSSRKSQSSVQGKQMNAIADAAISHQLGISIRHLTGSTQEADPGQDVINGLSQQPKTLPARYFYDDRGSELFEQICQLPEYYLTRTETQILEQFASDIAQLTGDCELIELGSGSSTKTRLLLDAYQAQETPLHYVPIDVSAGMLEKSAQQLRHEYPAIQVHGIAATYNTGLANLQPSHLSARMLMFIGSSLGNLNEAECDRFLTQIANALNPGDYFLLGLDLQKPKAILEAAYNDAQGVTAEFNLNMLRHLNQRFDGNFDLSQFKHQAIYDAVNHQIEMYLHSLTDQTVKLDKLDFQVKLAQGEAIRTEISRKFDPTAVRTLLSQHNLPVQKLFTDSNHWFGLFLCQLTPTA